MASFMPFMVVLSGKGRVRCGASPLLHRRCQREIRKITPKRGVLPRAQHVAMLRWCAESVKRDRIRTARERIWTVVRRTTTPYGLLASAILRRIERVAFQPALDLHARLAHLAADGGEVALVGLE